VVKTVDKQGQEVILKQLFKQMPGTDNDSALKHKHNFRNKGVWAYTWRERV